MARKKKIIITKADRARLGVLLEQASQERLINRQYLDDLERELEQAKVLDASAIPADVITMNSTVRLRDLDTEELLEFTLAYPAEADVERNRISILAPVGTAIIGYRVGDVVEWPVPAGKIHLKVEEVVYQPEAVGAFER